MGSKELIVSLPSCRATPCHDVSPATASLLVFLGFPVQSCIRVRETKRPPKENNCVSYSIPPIYITARGGSAVPPKRQGEAPRKEGVGGRHGRGRHEGGEYICTVKEGRGGGAQKSQVGDVREKSMLSLVSSFPKDTNFIITLEGEEGSSFKSTITPPPPPSLVREP